MKDLRDLLAFAASPQVWVPPEQRKPKPEAEETYEEKLDRQLKLLAKLRGE